MMTTIKQVLDVEKRLYGNQSLKVIRRLEGMARGTVKGKEFADALLACWLGPKPPSADFKAGLLNP